MFVGHYAVALGAKAIAPQLPLGVLFAAAQLSDVAFSVFVVFGWERIAVDDSAAGPDAVALASVPFSHSLLASIVTALVAWAVIRALPGIVRGSRDPGRTTRVHPPPCGTGKNGSTHLLPPGAVVAAVVTSHFWLDVASHPPELPLIGGGVDSGRLLGLGLGSTAVAAFALEGSLLAIGLVIYLRTTRPLDTISRWAPIAFVAAMLAFLAVVVVTAPASSPVLFAASNLGAYAVLALVAGWIDTHRRPAREHRPIDPSYSTTSLTPATLPRNSDADWSTTAHPAR